MVDIVIVNWNAGDLLKKCVDSIIHSENLFSVNKVIIVDNNSIDSSIREVPLHSKIRIIQNRENLGFAKACNQGFACCFAPYVLLLNPDTQLKTNTLLQCLQFMESKPGIDILGCQLLNDTGAVTVSCARFPTAGRLFMDATGISRIAPGYFKPAILMTDWNHGESRYVDQVMGAFMFMRSDVFEKIGYFDERYFVYYEELDYSLKLAKAGGKIYYNADIQAIHSGMGTTEAVKAFRLYLNLQSRLKYAKKNFTQPAYLLVFATTYSVEFISRFVFLILKRKTSEIKDLTKAYRLLLGF